MAWINEHKRIWRAAILLVGVVAFIGPWGFDLINVPAEYPCSAPFVRLEGDFCGLPLEGFRIFSWFPLGLVSTSIGLVTGEVVFSDWTRGLLSSLYPLLLVLPLFGTLLLLLRGEGQRRQLFVIAAWGLAAGMSVVIALLHYPGPFRVLWGIWLFIGLGVGALTMEVLALRRSNHSTTWAVN